MRYRLCQDYLTLRRGAILVETLKFDFGIAKDDSEVLGEECRSVSIDGDYPLVSVPVRLLEPQP